MFFVLTRVTSVCLAIIEMTNKSRDTVNDMKCCSSGNVVREELSKLFSPEFDVSVSDISEVVSILNIVKAKCALLPSKFRHLVGLLCQVDLSITDTEKHYEQLMVKNRIYHLLRMFPDVAHILLDVITRATNNQCSALSHLPVSAGTLQADCQAPQQIDISRSEPATSTLAVPATNSSIIPLIYPQQLHTSHQPQWSSLSSQQTPVVRQLPTNQSQPRECDTSQRIYGEVPYSIYQTPSQSIVGVARNLTTTTASQKRIPLLQQHHLGQRLEISQVPLPQQARSRPEGCVIQSSKMMPDVKTKCETPCYAVFDASRYLKETFRGWSQKQPCERNNGRSSEPLDLTSLVSGQDGQGNAGSTEDNTKTSESSKLKSKQVMEQGGRGNVIRTETDGLMLSQVGQHCIMVSIRDSETAPDESKSCSARKMRAVSSTAGKSGKLVRSGKATAHRGRSAVINVQRLCHMHNTRQSGKIERGLTHQRSPGSNSPGKMPGTSDDGKTKDNTPNKNNNNNGGITKSEKIAHPNKTRSLRITDSNPSRPGITFGSSPAELTSESQPYPTDEPMDLSSDKRRYQKNDRFLKVTNAQFHPVTGHWHRKSNKISDGTTFYARARTDGQTEKKEPSSRAVRKLELL